MSFDPGRGDNWSTGAFLFLSAPLFGIMGEEISESRNKQRYFLKNSNTLTFDARVWQIDLDSMLSNNNPVEQN